MPPPKSSSPESPRQSAATELEQQQPGSKSSRPAKAYIGLGANLGEAHSTIEKAIDSLIRQPAILSWSVSPLYRSAPLDADGPDYVNAVMRVDTRLKPTALLDLLQKVERDFGRKRTYQNAPRILDLDLILYDMLQMVTPALRLPHPRMHLRAFVLAPMAQLDADIVIPGLGSINALLDAVNNQACTLIPGSVARHSEQARPV